MGLKIPKSEQQLDDQAELLRQLIGLCEQHGVVLNLHNHTYEVENDMQTSRARWRESPDQARAGPQLADSGRGGSGRLHPRVRQADRLHAPARPSEGRPLGRGNGRRHTDFVAIGRALHEINFEGDAVIELAHEKDFKPTRPMRESSGSAASSCAGPWLLARDMKTPRERR